MHNAQNTAVDAARDDLIASRLDRAGRRQHRVEGFACDGADAHARTIDDLEISHRLRQVIRAIESPLQRHALELREQGANYEARLLIAAFDVTEEAETRTAIVARLRTLADSADVEVKDASPNSQAVIAAWRELLQ